MRHLRQAEDDLDRSADPQRSAPLLLHAETNEDIAPTDSDVYGASVRPPAPRPSTSCPQTPRPERVYNKPRTPVSSTITPTSDLLREILSEIEENHGIDVVSDVRLLLGSTPPPPYQDLREPESSDSSPYFLVEGTYVEMTSKLQPPQEAAPATRQASECRTGNPT